MTEPMIEATEPETEEFADELSDEALDREQGWGKSCCYVSFSGHSNSPEPER
jgi:hypothetical protein